MVVFIAQESISLVPPEEPSAVVESSIKALEELSLANMLIFQKASGAIMLDLRDEQFYRYSHIAGSINLPLDNFSSKLYKKLLKRLKSSANIIIYSNAYANDELRHAVEVLAKNGIKDVKVYSAGWEEWKACKLPVEKSK